jgi:hypothetical protein
MQGKYCWDSKVITILLTIFSFSCNAGVVDMSAAKQTLVGDVLECAKQELEGCTRETNSKAEN